MTRIFFAMVTALSLAGCVTVPKTSSELVQTSSTSHTFCYAKPPHEVSRQLETFLGKCYGRAETVIPLGGAYVPIRADFQVLNEQLQNGNRYSVRNFVGFGYAANVVPGAESCNTEVKMYAITGLWQKTFAAADAAISTGDIKCP